ncbi:hypothetical protein SAMN05216188_101352 [Lentzea xinjiangensis]|uniref:Nucleotidyltransferase n=1 Tax=Lentzea xinjiangensis TaxID=402600 RepID=A0A1H9AD72_9PSEU|nr:hypothetical protein [Lentzea xinjiangensis]SEP74383.1 hypothetical protein SAMN05216188_101352 [Lentzea xinjiangensis]
MSSHRVPFDAAEHPLFRRLDQLDLDRDNFAIFGSAPLYIRKMIPSIGDLDIVARGSAWERACRLGKPVFTPPRGVPIIQFWEGKIEVFSEWLPRLWDADFLIDQSEWLGGFRFVRLECVVTYKLLLQRPKDLVHLDQVRSNFTAEHASLR